MKVSWGTIGFFTAILILGVTGCATKSYVREEVTALETKVDANRTEIDRLSQANAQQDAQLAQLSASVQEAMQRAEEAGKLAKGKFVCEVKLTEDAAYFAFDKSELTDKANAALSAFAQRMKDENRNVYIEIQGHTDAIGPEAYNLQLGMARARAVKYYLYTRGGIALHRMDTFSYGESRPIADNRTPENRAKNRRVTLVVME